MKNILIPTDFSIKSLKLVKAAVERFPEEQLQITLVHALKPDHSISGLLMLNKRLTVHQLYTAEFTEACEVLRNKYASVLKKIRIEFYYGSSKSYLKNFLEARSIDAILLARDYTLQPPSKAGRDLYPELRNSGYPVFEEPLQTATQRTLAGEASLSELLPA
ncbi:universal stress protein [Taibaiella koreensis]|uniref:universal stress protein n=1 Tax=Taibaiella koreensis TaxID=1268548 RepID=UPI000E59F563|nr:universal stress protein [Taibaiella koreensis]